MYKEDRTHNHTIGRRLVSLSHLTAINYNRVRQSRFFVFFIEIMLTPTEQKIK